MSPSSVSRSLCLALQKPIKSTSIVLSTHVMAPWLFLSTLFKTRSMLCSSSAVEVNVTMFCINESIGPEVCAHREIERIRRAINNVLSLDSQTIVTEHFWGPHRVLSGRPGRMAFSLLSSSSACRRIFSFSSDIVVMKRSSRHAITTVMRNRPRRQSQEHTLS